MSEKRLPSIEAIPFRRGARTHFRSLFNGRHTLCGWDPGMLRVSSIKKNVTCKRCLRMLAADDNGTRSER